MYIVMEIQKTGDNLSTFVTTHNTRNEADSKFYTILSYAAVSKVPLHAASLLSEDGRCHRSEVYEHPIEE